MASMQPIEYRFPAPIGGVPFDLDFVPSIIFAAIYASISMFALYRMARPSTRNIYTLGSLIYVTERAIVFALRAKVAHDPSLRTSDGLTKYWQATFANGYIGVLTSVGALLRTLLVNATHPPPSPTPLSNIPERAYDGLSSRSTSTSAQPSYSVNSGMNKSMVDRKRTRIVYRIAFGHLTLLTVLALLLAIIQGAKYIRAESEVAKAKGVQVLRYASSALALFALLLIHTLTLRAYLREPRIPRLTLLLLSLSALLITMTTAYRLAAMRFRTPALTASGPGTLNGTGAKAAFYVLHIVPELGAGLLVTLCGVNVLHLRAVGGAGSGVDAWTRGTVGGGEEVNELESMDKGKSKDTVQIVQIPV